MAFHFYPLSAPFFCACFPALRHLVAVVAWHLLLRRGCGRAACLSGVPCGPLWCAVPRPVQQGPVWGCPWRVPLALVLGLVRCGGFACVDPVTHPSGFPCRPLCDGVVGRCSGAVLCGRRHHPLQVSRRHVRVPCVCVCTLVSWPSRAGRPPGRVLVRLTFPFAILVSVFVFSAPCGLGLPRLLCCPPPPFFFLCFSASLSCAPFGFGFLLFPALGALGHFFAVLRFPVSGLVVPCCVVCDVRCCACVVGSRCAVMCSVSYCVV